MSTTANRPSKRHEGHNVKRFREILGVKQEALAADLGEEWTQKKVSSLEAKEKIGDEVMDQVAKALNIPAAAIRDFDEEKTIFNIQHNYEGSNQGEGSGAIISGDIGQNTYNFNPLNKLIEAYEENKKLYERLLQSEKEKVEMLRAKG